ncbi:MAG: cytochrome c [Chloroflexi bacterium]|nr:cytochrome c [Chloroflexota bacterium]MBI4216624.1 cytochrome c [Chloroflexota bacterium]
MTSAARYLAATIPALAVLGLFVWFANWIPQTRWEPPQKQAITASMTPVQLAALGETVTRQRGCLACHTIEPGVGVKGGGRGPNWADIALRRAQGVPGGQGNLVDYLVEALYEPGAYLVERYANIMPAATAAPAKLTYEEMVAVVDYLQSLGGRPSVRIGDIRRPPGAAGVGAAPAQAGLPKGETSTDPVAILAGNGCSACHSLKPGEVLVGPSLDPAGLKQGAAQRGISTEAYIMESIVAPNAFVKPGAVAGVMPQDFGTKLTAGQLQALVAYLLSPRGGQ